MSPLPGSPQLSPAADTAVVYTDVLASTRIREGCHGPTQKKGAPRGAPREVSRSSSHPGLGLVHPAHHYFLRGYSDMSLATHDTGLPKSYSSRTFSASFKADPELWSRFKTECKLRGVSVCHVLEALMEAWIQGQKVESTLLKPVVINLKMEHIVQRPRRLGLAPIPAEVEMVEKLRARYGVCYRLQPRGEFPGKIGWCPWLKRWIRGLECSTCINQGERH